MAERTLTTQKKTQMIYLICAILMGLVITSAPATAASGTSTMDELKANYLGSIYEDCRIFLEGIELFISRDYPKFWVNMETGRPLAGEEIRRYTRELKYFEGQLDALYEEFISYADTSANKKEGGQEKIKALEAKIYQILAYAYMRTGDFAMSYALMSNENIIAQNFTLPLMDIEGKEKTFHLTRDLKNLHSLINANLNTIELRMKYFFPTDLEAVNAYLKVETYQRLNPVNLTFLSYYDKAFLELGESKKDIIHFSEIIHFFNQMKYNNAFSKGNSTTAHERIYRLPIIKGTYGMDLKDSSILGAVSSDNRVLALERLCLYKGFARTDFRNLKVEEKQNIVNKTTVDRDLYISRMDGDPSGELKNGAHMEYFGNVPKDGKLTKDTPLRYGTYSLFEGTEFLGIIELVPCYKGQPCTKRNSDKAVTEVKVYNHELTFYEDTLDFIRMNTRMHGKMKNITRNDPKEIHVGRGCASGKK